MGWSEQSVADIDNCNETKDSMQSQRSVSYMSNNTMMLNDLHLQLDPLLVNESEFEVGDVDCLHDENEDGDADVDDDDNVVGKTSVSPPPIFAQRKASNVLDGGEDEIIKSPIELNKNMSFGIRVAN